MSEGEFSKHIGVNGIEQLFIDSGALESTLYERILENSRPETSGVTETENVTEPTIDIRRSVSVDEFREAMKTWPDEKLLDTADKVKTYLVYLRARHSYWQAIRNAAVEIAEDREDAKFDATNEREMEELVKKLTETGVGNGLVKRLKGLGKKFIGLLLIEDTRGNKEE